LNLLGTQFGGLIQAISTIGKLIPIILIAVFGIFQGKEAIFNAASGSSHATVSMGAAVLATLWAYDGWMNVGYMAGEMKNPSKTLPRAIISGIVIVIIAYLSVNIAMFHVLPAEQVVKLGPNAAATAATSLFGGIGGKILAIGILISIFGCLNGKILTFPRITLAMAERGFLPGAKTLSSIHPKFKTPVAATILELIIAVAMMIFGNPDRLTDIAVFSVFLCYGLAFFAVFILRKRDIGDKSLYKVPLYPITPIIAIIGTIYIIVSTLMNAPMDAVISIGIAIIGLPVYWKLKGKMKDEEEVKAS
jgi:APA family basic amino acid/polyamine antiporter